MRYGAACIDPEQVYIHFSALVPVAAQSHVPGLICPGLLLQWCIYCRVKSRTRGRAGKNLEGRTPAGANAEAAPIAASSAIVRMFSLYEVCRFVFKKLADMVSC